MSRRLRLLALGVLLAACSGEGEDKGERVAVEPPGQPAASAVTDDAAAKVPTDEIELIVLGMT